MTVTYWRRGKDLPVWTGWLGKNLTDYWQTPLQPRYVGRENVCISMRINND
jgi:hypothetical protein